SPLGAEYAPPARSRIANSCRFKVSGKIIAFPGDDVSNAAAGIRDVPRVARDDVYVKVRNSLAGSAANVDSDVVPRGSTLIVDDPLSRSHTVHEAALLLGCGLKPGGDMPTRYDQSVTWGNGESVPHRENEFVNVLEDAGGIHGAEGTEYHADASRITNRPSRPAWRQVRHRQSRIGLPA